jgi:hypothetical protein
VTFQEGKFEFTVGRFAARHWIGEYTVSFQPGNLTSFKPLFHRADTKTGCPVARNDVLEALMYLRSRLKEKLAEKGHTTALEPPKQLDQAFFFLWAPQLFQQECLLQKL